MEIQRIDGNGRRSTAVKHGNTVYVSGITATDITGDIAAQTKDVLQQIDAALRWAGTDKNHVLSATVMLADMADYGEMNAVWEAWVIDAFEPARCVLQSALELDEYKVKISVIAATGK